MVILRQTKYSPNIEYIFIMTNIRNCACGRGRFSVNAGNTECVLCRADDASAKKQAKRDLSKIIDEIDASQKKLSRQKTGNGASSSHISYENTNYKLSIIIKHSDNTPEKQNTDNFDVEHFVNEVCTTPNPFQCELCGLSFAHNFYLKKHLSSVHEQKREFICKANNCGASFKAKAHLSRHETIHNRPDAPFKCEYCSAGFDKCNTLSAHQRSVHGINTGFTCDICSKSFATPGAVERHKIYGHSTNRPFQCEQCISNFKFHYDLKKHVKRQHINIGIFKCECGKEFNIKDNLTKHKKICNKWLF